MASKLGWVAVFIGAGGILYNTTSLSVPIISDIADVPLSGIVMAVGLWGYFMK